MSYDTIAPKHSVLILVWILGPVLLLVVVVLVVVVEVLVLVHPLVLLLCRTQAQVVTVPERAAIWLDHESYLFGIFVLFQQ